MPPRFEGRATLPKRFNRLTPFMITSRSCRRSATFFSRRLARHFAWILPAIAVSAVPSLSGAGLTLANSGVSSYRIVIAQNARPSEKHAAEELQKFLEQISGAKLPITTDAGPLGSHEIILGRNNHLDPAGVTIDFPSLGDEGFVLRTVGSHLVIAGGGVRGSLYGVYSFLEDHLGCRWFTPSVSRIPKTSRLVIAGLDEKQTPKLEYREVFYRASQDADWSARNRLNSKDAGNRNYNGMLPEQDVRGGLVTYFPFGHSFYKIIPPEKYFDQHPEWFSEVDGKRTAIGRFKRAQLCLTNEAMIQESIKIVRQWIKEHPEATIVSVAQNDGPGGWCECKSCAELEAKEGNAHSAPIIYYVNRIAAAVAEESPKVAIDTLAYSYSAKAPRTLKPLPNVVIRLTTGACCSHSIDNVKCEKNLGMRTLVSDWFKLTQRMYIWDYVINFRQYLLPFPNFGALSPNVKFFADHGVRGVFEQGSGEVEHSDMAPLKAYLLAKLLWNPDYDVKKGTEEFLDEYFGPAAKPIGAYLASLQAEVDGGDMRRFHMGPFEPSLEAPYLSLPVLVQAMKLFNQAERLAANDPERLKRVRTARLSLDYFRISMIGRVNALASPEEAELPVRKWYRGALNDFFSTAERNGVTHIREANRTRSSMADFRQDLEAGISNKEGNGPELE